MALNGYLSLEAGNPKPAVRLDFVFLRGYNDYDIGTGNRLLHELVFIIKMREIILV
jgi:hypothetical protein